MKLGVVIEESKVLETNLNLRTDLTGKFARMLRTMFSRRWSFVCRRIVPSFLVWDIFMILFGGRGE